jgi:hypothetical protein
MTAGQEKRLKAKIRKQWDIDMLVHDLFGASWRRTEPGRFDRMIWIASNAGVKANAKEVFPVKEWKEAEEAGFEHEITDDYVNALAEVVSKAISRFKFWPPLPRGVKEWRPSQAPLPMGFEHVYATFEDGDAYLGQLTDLSAEELRFMGFKVEE